MIATLKATNPRGNQTFLIWSDLNDDGNVQPTEVVFQKATNGGITILPDVSFCVMTPSLSEWKNWRPFVVFHPGR